MIKNWNLKAICQQVSYFLSCWYFLIKSETNLPVIIPPQQLRSIRVERFQAAMLFGKYVMYFVYWYEWCGTVVAWYEQHGGLTRVYVSCFVVVIGKKIEFWYDQCSHGQTAFCSYVLSQTALYLQKVICGKKKDFTRTRTVVFWYRK